VKQIQTETSLSAEGVTVGNALTAVTLSLPTGQLTGIIGPNGSGKTTLLRCLAGDRKPDSGRVYLGEHPLESLKPRERAPLLTYLPQTTPISFAFTLKELVGLQARSPDTLASALEAMELESLADRSLLTLSGGERQRGAIARVLAQATPVLLLDEPLAHLDLRYQKRLLEFLVKHCQTGGSVALALHELRLARDWCDSLVLLHQGKLVAQGAPEEILIPKQLEAVFGVGADFAYLISA
jgi:iron complex transport system ATP-binding protein